MNKRVQMDLSERSFDRLKKLKKEVDAASYSEVLRDALQLYEFFVLKDQEKKRFFVETEDGHKQEIKIFI